MKKTQKTKRIPKSRYPRGAEVFYLRELRKLIKGWLQWLSNELTLRGIRMDAPEDPRFWDAFFGEAKAEWTRRVSTFTIKLKMTARQIAEISGQQWSDQLAVFMGAQPFRSEPWLEREIEGFVLENVNLIKDIGEQTANRMQTLVTDGVKKGTSTRNIAKQLKEQFGYSDSRAKLIAADQTGKFNATLTETRHKKAGVLKYEWSTTKDERVRKAHRARDGQIFSYDKPPADGNPGEAVRCFPYESNVALFSDIVRLYRRRYSGELSFIVSDDGTVLKGTPNHPILTNRGWVGLQEVNVGDYVIKTFNQGLLSVERNEQNIYSSIGQIFDFFDSTGCSKYTASGVSGQFHGDGIINENVDIITLEGGLLNAIEPGMSKEICQEFLSQAHMCFGDFPTLRNFSPEIRSLFFPSNRNVSGFSEVAAFCFGHSTHSDDVCFAAISKLYSSAEQCVANGVAFDAVLFMQLQDAFTRKIIRDNGIFIKLLSVCARAIMPDHGVTISSHKLTEPIGINIKAGGNFAEIFTGIIQGYSRVNKVFSEPFIGHVYNLETKDNWYITNNYTTKNCRCIALPLFDDETNWT